VLVYNQPPRLIQASIPLGVDKSSTGLPDGWGQGKVAGNTVCSHEELYSRVFVQADPEMQPEFADAVVCCVIDSRRPETATLFTFMERIRHQSTSRTHHLCYSTTSLQYNSASVSCN